MNSYGLLAINAATFNIVEYPQPLEPSYTHFARNLLITTFKVHHLLLNTLGYFAFFCPYIGCVRFFTTSCFFLASRQDTHFYKLHSKEILETVMALYFRALMECLSWGRRVNIALDLLATPLNVAYVLKERKKEEHGMLFFAHQQPYYDPPLWFLNLV